MRETRGHVLHAHVLMALKHSGRTQADFADAVAHLYAERTPLHARSIEFHAHVAGSNPYDVHKANAQILFRMLRPEFTDSRMPVELEEAVVLALPAPFQDECQRELAERLGLLAAPLPVGVDAPLAQQMKSPCELLRRAAAAVESIAPMLDDNNHIGPEDAAHFGKALQLLADVQAAAISITAQIGQSMDQSRGNNVRVLRTGTGDGKL